MARVPVNQPYSTAQSIPFGSPDPNARFKRHAGIDYALPTGREVYAPASGSITSYIFGTYHGKVVEIYTGKEFVHMLHNSELKVHPGDKVVEGEVVSLSGSTGIGVTGPHVHFGVSKVPLAEVTSFADFIDPNEWLKGGNMATDSLTKEEIILQYSQAFDCLEKDVNQDVVKAFTGKPLGQLLNFIKADPSYKAHFKQVNTPTGYKPVSKQLYEKV